MGGLVALHVQSNKEAIPDKAVGLADGAAGATEAKTCIAVGLGGRFAGETDHDI